MRTALLLLCLVTSCVKSNSVACPNGDVCPAGTECDTANGGCIDEAQLTACGGMVDGVSCVLPDGVGAACLNGVCLGHVCGDGRRSGPERCDPTATATDDTMTTCIGQGFYEMTSVTCKADCSWDLAGAGCLQTCGDGEINGPELCESSMPLGGTCFDFGYDRGALGCASCAASFIKCGLVGWKSHTTTGHPVAGAAAGDTVVIAFGDALAPPAARLDGNTWVPLGMIPLASGYVISRAVSVVSADDIWVAGELVNPGSTGFAAHYNGTGWTYLHELPSPATIVWASGSTAYVVTNQQTERYDGTSWTPVTLPGAVSISAIAGTSADDVWVLGNKLWHGGATQPFIEVALPTGTVTTTGLFVLPTGAIFVASHDNATNRELVHIRQGTTWATVPYPTLGANAGSFYASAVDDFYVLFTGTDPNTFGGIVETARYDGTRWTVLSVTEMFDAFGLVGSPKHGVIALDTNGQRALHYSGSAWLPDRLPTSSSYVSVTVVSKTEVYALRSDGLLWRFDGRHWLASPETAQGPVDTIGPAATYAFDIGPATLWHRTAASTWTPLTLPVTTTSYSIPFAVAGEGDVFLTEDFPGDRALRHWNGTAIETTNLPPGLLLNGLDCAPAAGCYAITNDTVWHTTGDRNAWAQVSGVGISDMRSLWIANTGEVFIGDAGGRVAWLGGAPATWHQVQLGSFLQVAGFAGNNGSDVFAFTYSITGAEALYWFDGSSWSEARIPYAVGAALTRGFSAGDGVTHLIAEDANLGNRPLSMRLVRTRPW